MVVNIIIIVMMSASTNKAQDIQTKVHENVLFEQLLK